MNWTIGIIIEIEQEKVEITDIEVPATFKLNRHKSFHKDDLPHASILNYINNTTGTGSNFY